MRIQIKLMGMLKDHAPPAGSIELVDRSTIEMALAHLDVDSNSVHVFTVNGSLERNKQRELADGDELTVLPPVGGG